MARFEVRVDGNVCKGCELCRIYCPKKIIAMSRHINDRGYSPAELTDAEACTGCRSCAVMCPDGAISIFDMQPAQSVKAAQSVQSAQSVKEVAK